GGIQLLLANLAHVPDDVRRQSVPRIQARLSLHQVELRERLRIAMRLHERQFTRGQLLLDRDWNVIWTRLKAFQLRSQIIRIQLKPRGNQIDMFGSQILARQPDLERLMVVDDHPSVAIENFSARSVQRHRLDAISLRKLAVRFMIPNLQNPKPGNQEEEN